MRTRKMMPMMFMMAAAGVLSWAVTAFAGDSNPGVAPPTSSPHGKTYGEWAAEQAKWGMAIPLGVNPANDPDGSQCAINQAGPVWFLAGTFNGSASRNCTIPAGKAIFFPLDAYFDDYPCPDPNFRPAPGQSLEAFLIADAKTFVDPVNELEADLDGRVFTDLFSYRAHSRLFPFTAPISLHDVDGCVTGSPQLAVVDGYWLFLEPLSPGEHTLHFRAASPAFSIEVTYHLTIRLRLTSRVEGAGTDRG